MELKLKDKPREFTVSEDNKISLKNNDYKDYYCICGQNDFEFINHYSAPPSGEMSYDLKNNIYSRNLMRCKFCGHFILTHNYNLEEIYSGLYTNNTYQNKLIQNFTKIINLSDEKSDNNKRVNNVINICNKYFNLESQPLDVLDVGSGLCVFLYLLSQKTNWTLLALDPDNRQSQHAQGFCQIPSICSDFFSFSTERKFNLISFNKVLEHVMDPVKMLSHAKKFLAVSGLIYIELPDGTEALKDSVMREEFFIEHYHAFSIISTNYLIEKAGFTPLSIERIKEPSEKYTLRAFCTHTDKNNGVV